MSGGGSSMARRAGVVALFTLGSRVLGYIRDAVLAQAFGAGAALDAFVAAQTIPNVFRRLVAEGTLMIAFVPILTEVRAREDAGEVRRFLGAVLGVLLPVLLVLTVAGMLVPGVFVDAFAAGFDDQRALWAESMTRIMMPFLFFVSLVALAAGTLNAFDHFAAPAAAPILLNLGIIGAVSGWAGVLTPGVEAAAWGVLVGGVLQWVLQLPWLARKGLLVAPRWEPRHPDLRRLLVRMLPAVFGVGVYQLNLVVIRQIASFLPDGQMSCYFYATRLEEFALGVFAVSISIAALPTLSRYAVAKDRVAFTRTFGQALRATNFVTIPAMAGLLYLGEPIVGALFRRGAFSAADAELTVQLLKIMAFALVPIGVVRVMVPAYYAVGDTQRPVFAACGSLFTTVVLGTWLGPRYEIAGLTLATVLASVCQAGLLLLWFRRRVVAPLGDEGGAEASSWFGHAALCVAAIAPWVAAGVWAADALDWSRGPLRIPALMLLVGAIGAGYLFSARLLRIPEVELLLGALRRRVRRAP